MRSSWLKSIKLISLMYMENIQNFFNLFSGWIFTHGLKILIIALVAYFVYVFVLNFLEKVVHRTLRLKIISKDLEEKRAATLIRVIKMTLRVLILTIAIVTIFSEIGINIAPVLAAAGVLGLAIGFGSQFLIRDIVSGLFIILENQYRVGDTIIIDNITGAVEDLNLRLTVIRDEKGAVHYIPNGEIKKVANLSKNS